MAWRRQATSHYLKHCWPKPMTPYSANHKLLNIVSSCDISDLTRHSFQQCLCRLYDTRPLIKPISPSCRQDTKEITSVMKFEANHLDMYLFLKSVLEMSSAVMVPFWFRSHSVNYYLGRWILISRRMAMHFIGNCVWLYCLIYMFNSFWSSDVYKRQWTVPTLILVMACRRLWVKPLLEPMLTYYPLSAHFSEENRRDFIHKKYTWKYFLQNVGYFVQAPGW